MGAEMKGDRALLTADEHVQWIADEVALLLAVTEDQLAEPTPSCPGWTVATVLDHLARGAGMGWATWFREPADIDGMAALQGVTAATTSAAARDLFHHTMPGYVNLLRTTPPNKPCFWFTGAVPATYLFRLGAVEIATHRADVDLALGRTPELAPQRAQDAVRLSAEFLSRMWLNRGEPAPAALQLRPTGGEPVTVGSGDHAATAAGSPTDLWLALWGRPSTGIQVDGNPQTLPQWSTSSPTSPI